MTNIVTCSDGTWQSPESDTSTHVLRLAEDIAPENAEPKYNEYKGFYEVMGRKFVLSVEPVLHVSVKRR